MAGLVPAIHALPRVPKNVDARDKPGHDGLHSHMRSLCCERWASRHQRGVLVAIDPALRRQQADDLGVGAGLAEQKTLALVAAFGAEAAQLGFGLDALGGDDDAEA